MARETRAVAAVVERLQRPSLLRRPAGFGHFDLSWNLKAPPNLSSRSPCRSKRRRRNASPVSKSGRTCGAILSFCQGVFEIRDFTNASAFERLSP